MIRPTSLLLWVMLASICVGCGYHAVGRGGAYPGGITSIGFFPLENRTTEPNLEAKLLAALRKEIISRRDIDVAASTSAQGVLRGKVTTFTTGSIAYDREARAREYRVTIGVDMELIRRRDGTLLWKGNNIQRHREYRASSEVLINEESKNNALRDLVEELAEEIYFRMKEGF